MSHLLKLLTLCLGVLISAAIPAQTRAQTQAQTQAQTLKIATVAPDGTNWMKEMRKGAREVSMRTAGRVKFKFFPGGIMGSEKSVLRKIRIGQLHGSALMGGDLSAIHADAHIYSLPFAFRSLAEVDYVRAKMDEALIAGLYRHGFVSFGFADAGFSHLASIQPIRSVADLKGRKVWVPEGDRVGRAALDALGVSPVSLPLVDVLTGLQTGLIDTVGNSPIGHIALQWHTRERYLTDVPLLYLYGTLVVQRKKFETLKKADQAVVRQIIGGVLKKIGGQTRLDNQEARQALSRQGITFVSPTPQGLRKWRGLAGETIKRLSRRGVFSAAMLKTLQDHLKEYRHGPASQN